MQLDAFGRVTFPRAHRNDPRSSHEAAAEGERTGLFKTQLELTHAWGMKVQNCTTAELHRAMKQGGVKGMDLAAVRRRTDELKQVNRATRIDPTEHTMPCAVSRKRVCRWEFR